MITTTSTYPQRQPFFAHRYCRLLTKTCAAQDIGHIAFVLCVTIAHQEDAKRYKSPVTFFNEQLMPLIGVSKWDALDRARKRAAKVGWLRYEPGNRGQRLPGKYWVTIPAGLDDLGDAPCDETHSPPNGERDGEWGKSQYPANGDRNETQSPTQPPANGEREGEREGERGGELSSLTLNHKKARPRFQKPTLEEVTSFCRERGKGVDPEAWLNHYEANGWKVGKNSMKDWKAAVRTWERNGFPTGKPEPPQPAEVPYPEY